jgi:hypothetical protein
MLVGGMRILTYALIESNLKNYILWESNENSDQLYGKVENEKRMLKNSYKSLMLTILINLSLLPDI